MSTNEPIDNNMFPPYFYRIDGLWLLGNAIIFASKALEIWPACGSLEGMSTENG